MPVPPKPTAIRKLEGNLSRRPFNESEPEFRGGAKCPEHLSKEAKREWRRLAPMLEEADVLKEADYIALGNLCTAYVTLQKAQAQLDQTGLLMKTQSGYLQQNPLISIVNSAMDTIIKLCREFGITPSSRSRITTDQSVPARAKVSPRKVDPIEQAICGSLPN